MGHLGLSSHRGPKLSVHGGYMWLAESEVCAVWFLIEVVYWPLLLVTPQAVSLADSVLHCVLLQSSDVYGSRIDRKDSVV